MGAAFSALKTSVASNSSKGLSTILSCFVALMLTVGCFAPWLNIDYCLDTEVKSGKLDKETQAKCDAQKTQDIFEGDHTEVSIFQGGGAVYSFVAFGVVVGFICGWLMAIFSNLAYSCPGKIAPPHKMWRFAYIAAIATAMISSTSFGVFIIGPVGLKHMGAGWPCTVIGAISATIAVCTLNCSQSSYAEMDDVEMQSSAPAAKPRRRAPPAAAARREPEATSTAIGRVHRNSQPNVARPGGRAKRGTMTPDVFRNLP